MIGKGGGGYTGNEEFEIFTCANTDRQAFGASAKDSLLVACKQCPPSRFNFSIKIRNWCRFLRKTAITTLKCIEKSVEVGPDPH